MVESFMMMSQFFGIPCCPFEVTRLASFEKGRPREAQSLASDKVINITGEPRIVFHPLHPDTVVICTPARPSTHVCLKKKNTAEPRQHVELAVTKPILFDKNRPMVTDLPPVKPSIVPRWLKPQSLHDLQRMQVALGVGDAGPAAGSQSAHTCLPVVPVVEKTASTMDSKMHIVVQKLKSVLSMMEKPPKKTSKKGQG